MLQIVGLPVLADNYIWLIHDPAADETVVIDPALADPVLEEVKARGWRITAIWNTHWHPDHTGGNEAIKAASGCTVIAPAAEAERIPTADRLVGEGDTVTLGDHSASVLEMPAHTSGHIVYHLAGDHMIFVGDVLFAMGCGRLFEGSAEQMFANMQRLGDLPDETQVYCAHEYTQANGRFAMVIEPENLAVKQRMIDVNTRRANGEATVPTVIGLEKATNPFLRATSAQQLAERRAAKDNFTG
ncbi:hydroxyacylglutathione hydrolase [Stakelama sp. CBK3Z-3]|uniref:Hydroxyacylglutathione hydrolase n=1 Tax=Stakelama flava TaxID=2860338 RepID=A0ABS6XNK8_9SPHN|nr:hydroxyacylglutathione hydrolase [Stakelama flava]